MQHILLLAANRSSFYSNTTWNPNDKGEDVTLSNGNLTVIATNGYGVRANKGHSSGKWYFENTFIQLESNDSAVIGIATSDATLVSCWLNGGEFTYYSFGGSASQLIWGENNRLSYGSAITTGDILGIAVDLDNLVMTYYKNGVSMGVAYTSSSLSAGTTYYPIVSSPDAEVNETEVTTAFTQSQLKYSPPVGFAPGW